MNVVLRCNGIWVINGKFGCTWSNNNSKLKYHKSLLMDMIPRDDDDDDDDDDMDVVEKPVSELNLQPCS